MTAVATRANREKILPKCGVCGGPTRPDVREPATTYAPRGQYGIATCEDCGCGATSPRPSSEELERQYARTYKYDAHALIASEKKWRARRILDAALRSSDQNVLDVGAMYGFLVEEAKRRGKNAVGVEPTDGPAEAARARGLDVFTGMLDAFARERGGTYDLIVVQHVLEHVPDLPDFMATLRSLLAPGGRVCICVPNFDARLRRGACKNTWGWYQVPVHVHHFGGEALKRVLEQSGFRVTKKTTNGGDSLFVMMTVLQTLGRKVSSEDAAEPGVLAKAVVRTASALLLPYYFVGDDELMVVAE